MLTSGFGMVSECSRSLVPRPPQNNTTFIPYLALRIRGAVAAFLRLIAWRMTGGLTLNTMTGLARRHALRDAFRYIEHPAIVGT